MKLFEKLIMSAKAKDRNASARVARRSRSWGRDHVLFSNAFPWRLDRVLLLAPIGVPAAACSVHQLQHFMRILIRTPKLTKRAPVIDGSMLRQQMLASSHSIIKSGGGRRYEGMYKCRILINERLVCLKPGVPFVIEPP